MCEILFSIFIVAAMESIPGWMTVEYMDAQTIQTHNPPVTKVIMLPTDEYISCLGSLG